MGKRLSEKNPFLRDPDRKRRLMLSAIASSQRQEGIEISDARAEEVYRIVFEEPPVAFFRLTQSADEREMLFAKALAGETSGVRFDVLRRDLLAVGGAPLSYWLPEEILRVFRQVPGLQPTFADARLGSHTGEDARLVRMRWEVREGSSVGGGQWMPFCKGGDFSRFYADIHLVVRWDPIRKSFWRWHGRKGRETERPESLDYYFRSGLTWPLAANAATGQPSRRARRSVRGRRAESRTSRCLPARL